MFPYAGLLCGLAVAMSSFTYAYFLGMAGNTVAAGAMTGVSALGVIGWFINARMSNREQDTVELKAATKPKSGRPGRAKGRR